MDVAVVGGGLAGLVSAIEAARAGRRVALFERAREIGGRARTTAAGEYRFNLGPHALYRDGAAARQFRELGLTIRGAAPPTSGGYAVRGGVAHTLPAGPISMLTTGLLPLAGKIELARFLAALPGRDLTPLRGLTVSEWLARELRGAEARDVLRAFLRLTSYANDPDRQSALAALWQLQSGLKGVLYLDDGWQQIVDGLREVAIRQGVRIHTGAGVRGVEREGGALALRLFDGAARPATAVVLAVAPSAASALVPGQAALAGWAKGAVPVRAASLDLALDRLPRPAARFALGIDTPVYFSVHSAVARLAPVGAVVLHAAKYLGPAPSSPDVSGTEAELEALVDLVQPGWRAHVVRRRFLPSLMVAHGLHTRTPRPSIDVPGWPGLFVAGDWVGEEGMLADAAVASARRAGREAAAMRPTLSAPAPVQVYDERAQDPQNAPAGLSLRVS